jgi:hypothetical protein
MHKDLRCQTIDKVHIGGIGVSGGVSNADCAFCLAKLNTFALRGRVPIADRGKSWLGIFTLEIQRLFARYDLALDRILQTAFEMLLERCEDPTWKDNDDVVWARLLVDTLATKRATINPHENALDAALGYVTRFGWKVFPARIDANGKKYSWLSAEFAPGHEPWGMSGDAEQIKINFKQRKWRDLCGVGIPTGAVNGIFVVDADTKKGHDKDGLAALKALEDEHSPLPDTLMGGSPTGSVHRYYKHPGGKVKSFTLVPGVDIKGDGGQVAAPPSRRPGFAAPYRWLNDLPIADAPPWLIELVQEQPRSAYSGSSVTADLEELRDAMPFVPNDDLDWDAWTKVGLALFAAAGDACFDLFDAFSQKSSKYDRETTRERWEEIKGCPPDRIGAGYIFKIARENGWVRKGEPTYVDAHTPIEAAREEIRRVVYDFFHRVGVPESERNVWIDHYFATQKYLREEGWPPIAHALRSPTGIGKTTEIIKRAGELKHALRGKLLYTVSTHRLGDILKDDQFAKGGLKAKVYRGRNAINPETLDPNMDPKDPRQERMCLNLEQVKVAIEAGLDVSTSRCIKRKSKNGAEQRCKFYDKPCGWQGQFLGDAPDVWVSAHEMLFHPQKAFGEDIAAVIVDEDFWQDGMRIAEHGVLLGDMESASSPLLEGYRKTLVAALRRQADLGGVERKYLVRRYVTNKDGGADFFAGEHTGLDAEDCTHAMSLEYEVLKKVKMWPGMGARDMKKVAKHAPALRRARQMHAIWASVRERHRRVLGTR